MFFEWYENTSGKQSFMWRFPGNRVLFDRRYIAVCNVEVAILKKSWKFDEDIVRWLSRKLLLKANFKTRALWKSLLLNYGHILHKTVKIYMF